MKKLGKWLLPLVLTVGGTSFLHAQVWWMQGVQSVNSLPATCSPGDPLYQVLTPPVHVYFCDSTNHFTQVDGGSGGIVGPGSSTNNAIVRWNGTTGSTVKNSSITASDAGVVNGISSLSINGGAGTQTLSTTATGFSINDAANSGFSLIYSLGGYTNNHTITYPDSDGTVAFVATTVPTTRTVSTTSPITGGGDLSANRTIACATCATTTNGGALSATAPVTISAGGVIACATCATGTVPTIATTSAVLKGDGGGNASASGLTETAAGTYRTAAGVSLDLATSVQTSDTAPVNTLLTGEMAYTQASTNTTGGSLILAGGLGSKRFTIVTFGSTGGKTVTITWNGTATTLTEGVDWTCVGTSNNTCASNLATAINANGTLGSRVTATASSANVGIDRKAGGNVYSLSLSTNAGAPLTATNGTDAPIVVPVGSATNPSIVGQGGTVTGFYWPTTLQLGITTNGVSRVLIDNNETRSSVNLSTAGNVVVTSTGCFVFSSSASTQGSLDTGLCRATPAVTKILAGTSGSGSLSYPPKAMTLSNGANNDLAIAGAGFVRITGPTGAFSISGFAAGQDGEVLRVFNATTQAMTITNQATSSASNQINTLTGADVVLRSGTSFASFIYDSTSSKWILTGTN